MNFQNGLSGPGRGIAAAVLSRRGVTSGAPGVAPRARHPVAAGAAKAAKP